MLQNSHYPEKGSTPDILQHRSSWVALIFVAAVTVFAGAIRITRGNVSVTIFSYREFAKSKTKFGRNICSWFRGKNCICRVIKSFCVKLPRRFRNFFIDAFLIPAYRNEWGKYKMWSYRSVARDPKSRYIRQFIRAQKRGQIQPSSRGPKVVHDHRGCERVRINVGGLRYETQLRTLERFPETLLGNPQKRIQHFDPLKQEYYFDRNRHAFESILYFYQSGGRFRRPDNVQADVLLEDAEFYQLSKGAIDQFRVDEGFSPLSSRQEVLPKNMLRRKLWLLFDDPDSSDQAALIAVISCFALIVSVVGFCLETLERFKRVKEHFHDSHGHLKETPSNLGPVSKTTDPFVMTETMCNTWFILEYVMRLVNCPVLWHFIKSPLNVIDVVAILPFILSHIIRATEDGANGRSDYMILNIIRVVRMARIFRIFKLSRHSRGLKILAKTLKASLNELVLLMVIIMIGSTIFSSAMYFAEQNVVNTKFTSIPEGLWWAIVTITTVGFGDVVPVTPLGKIVGGLCAIAGVLTTSLPVPVIVSNFNFFYHQAIDERDLVWISINHITNCPCRQYGSLAGEKTKKANTHSTVYSSDEEFGSLKKIKFD